MEYFKKAFTNSQEIHPEWGAYIHLCTIIYGTGASRQEVLKIFNKLMPEDEYDKPEKGELIDYLCLQASKPRYMA